MKKILLITLSFIGSSYSMQNKDFWTPEEDQKLTDLVTNYNGSEYGKWSFIASQMPGRKADQCGQRWFRSIDPNIKKGTWTNEEDQKLTDLVNSYNNGHPKWTEISKQISGRTPRQCRQRWVMASNPNINYSKWTDEEDLLLIRKYKELGPKWAKIKDFFNNRTDLQLRNRYKKIIMKKTKNSDFNKNEYFLDWNDLEYFKM